MKTSRFEEIIPASDLLGEELNDIRGGASGIICDAGIVCEVGEVTDDVPEARLKEC